MKMTVQEDIERAVAVMKAGGVVLYPTDTVWGLGCDASCPGAVRRIYDIKHRSDSKALISLVGSKESLRRCVGDQADMYEALSRKSGGRPLTVVFSHAEGLAGCLLADDGSAGIRLTSELYSSSLCESLGHPVVSTSANISGRPAPRFYREISGEIVDAVDYVAQYRRDDENPASPSMVVKILPDGDILTLRS